MSNTILEMRGIRKTFPGVVALDNVNLALAGFVDPTDDAKGKERNELMEEALELAGGASRSIESAQEAFKEADTEAGEPDDEDDD